MTEVDQIPIETKLAALFREQVERARREGMTLRKVFESIDRVALEARRPRSELLLERGCRACSGVGIEEQIAIAAEVFDAEAARA